MRCRYLAACIAAGVRPVGVVCVSRPGAWCDGRWSVCASMCAAGVHGLQHVHGHRDPGRVSILKLRRRPCARPPQLPFSRFPSISTYFFDPLLPYFPTFRVPVLPLHVVVCWVARSQPPARGPVDVLQGGPLDSCACARRCGPPFECSMEGSGMDSDTCFH